MRPIVISQTGTGSTAWIPMDWNMAPFAVGVGCVKTGTVNYTVEHTFDDVQDPDVTPTAFPHSSIATETANADGNYAFPVRAIRLTQNSGSGTTTMTLIQGAAR